MIDKVFIVFLTCVLIAEDTSANSTTTPQSDTKLLDAMFKQLAKEFEDKLEKDLERGIVNGEDQDHKTKYIANLPKTFDARKKWPECKDIIGYVMDQGMCATSWATQAAAVMSDRTCISSAGRTKRHLSAEDILGCCGEKCFTNPIDPCGEGDASKAMTFLYKEGAVTEDCRPYKPQNRTKINCEQSCVPGYTKQYRMDKQRIGNWYQLKPIKNDSIIQAEIYEMGPVEALLRVFEDFERYSDGVYRYTKGRMLYTHFVKIIGWGVENIGSEKAQYWLCVNSWGNKWGALKGLVKIYKGINNCGIETKVLGITTNGPNMKHFRGSPAESAAFSHQPAAKKCAFLVLILFLIIDEL